MRLAPIAAAAGLAGLNLLPAAQPAHVSEASPSGQDRVVVFEVFGQSG